MPKIPDEKIAQMEPCIHNKVYDGINIKHTDINIRLKDNELDNAIYYLICARDKLIKGEKDAYELRLWSAKAKINKLA